VTTDLGEPSDAELREVRYLRTPEAIRERAEGLYALGLSGRLAHFRVDEARLASVAELVVRTTRDVYPDVRTIPYHSRWRHFSVGGVDRVGRLDERLSAMGPDERLRSKFELVITSVLLDAGSGERWSFREDRETYTRSEGLAVASYHLFVNGGLADDATNAPLRADAVALGRFSADQLGNAFQIRTDNPLVGLEGRASILRTLGDVVARTPRYFGAEAPRLGNLATYLTSKASDGALPARVILEAVLDALGDIWPGRERCAGKNLGDVWTHPDVGRVPFHKLSQWLTYSLCEPLEEHGIVVTGIDELTGLAEYRNGGLFVDGGALVPQHDGVTSAVHEVSSTVVVEWRALTVALLDRTARDVRRLLGLSAHELPLAKVLEGGTWRAGRKLAFERRSGGSPPIGVASDGTVF
jgi:Protein of unknown function (DUF1688)